MTSHSTQITVTFDSNIWESLVDSIKRSGDKDCERIFELIEHRRIIPFFFEGIATIEAVTKSERPTYFPSYKGAITVSADNGFSRRFPGSPAPQLFAYLSENIGKALGTGFKFIRLPRIGLPRVPEEHLASDTRFNLEQRLERSFEFARYIEKQNMGRSEFEEKTAHVQEAMNVTECKSQTGISNKAYAKSVAEWSDGDALAAHYGYGLDYFCTRDQGKGAGANSVFFKPNIEHLTEKFGIRVVSPVELLSFT